VDSRFGAIFRNRRFDGLVVDIGNIHHPFNV
jgi:hypothetical protein